MNQAGGADSRADHIPFRAVVLFGSIIGGIGLVGILSWVFPAGDVSVGADLLVDRNTRIFPYPFTIQNVMWLAFSVAIGDLLVRHVEARRERAQIYLDIFPDQDGMALRSTDLDAIRARALETDPERKYWLQRLLTGAIDQFRNSGSVDRVNSMIDVSLELFQHEIELRYNMLRYVVWLIPTLGFVGTVLGIAFAMRTAGVMFAGASFTEAAMGPGMMERLTGDLGVAFYTTLLGLLQSAVLMFILHVLEEREERTVNEIGRHCLDNFSNRLREARVT